MITKPKLLPITESKNTVTLSGAHNVDSNPDGLEFVGAYVADLNINNAAWMENVPDPPTSKTEVGVDLKDTSIDDGPRDSIIIINPQDIVNVEMSRIFRMLTQLRILRVILKG